MNHQPFETWILGENPASAAEKELLKRHLQECPDCDRLQESWKKAHRQIVTAGIKKAPVNFVSNWQAKLVQFKEKRQRKIARTLLASYISGAIVALIALNALLLPKFSPIALVVGVASSVVRFVESIKEIWTILLSLVKVAPTTTLLVIGSLLAGWITLAALAWGVSVWRVSIKKVYVK